MHTKNPICQDDWASPWPCEPCNLLRKAVEKRTAQIVGRREGLFLGLDGGKADDRRQRGAVSKFWQAFASLLAGSVGDIRVADGASFRLSTKQADAEFFKARKRIVGVGEDATAGQNLRHFACFVVLNDLMRALSGDRCQLLLFGFCVPI